VGDYILKILFWGFQFQGHFQGQNVKMSKKIQKDQPDHLVIKLWVDASQCF